jgi:acyl carrier protein
MVAIRNLFVKSLCLPGHRGFPDIYDECMELPADLQTRVMQVIAKTQRIPPETVTIDSTFQDLKIDSLDGINLIFALESEFNIDIPDDEARAILTVRQMAEGVVRLIAQKAPV